MTRLGVWLCIGLLLLTPAPRVSQTEETANFITQYRIQRTVQFWADTLTMLGYTLTWTSPTTFTFIGVSYTTTDPIGPLVNTPLLFDIAQEYTRQLHSQHGLCRHDPPLLQQIALDKGWTGSLAFGEVGACGITGEGAVIAWTQSPGHAATLYAPHQQQVGVGQVSDWTFAIFSVDAP
jgi:hypothetical protein